MEDNFYKKSSLLILTNMTTGILAFLFSIILTRKIGAEGIGLFSLISPISSLLLSVLSGGLLLAVSKVISEYYTKNQLCNLHKSIKSIIIFNFISSTVLILIIYLFSYSISKKIIKDLRTLHAFRLILISIIFMTLSNTYKGYFYGTRNVLIPAFIDVLEKLIRILLLLIIFKNKLSDSIQINITISYLVFFIGELLSFILLNIYYKLDKRSHLQTAEKVVDSIQLIYNILVISIPLMFAELVSSSLYTISSLLLPRRLVVAGFSYTEALSLIGRFIGMSFQIVLFPSLIIFSISTILIPDIASKVAKDDIYNVKIRIKQVLITAFLLGITVLVICLFTGEKLGFVIFAENGLGKYIKFFAFCAPIIYVSQVSRSILNGLGKQNLIFKYTIILSLIQVFLLYILVSIPRINIYGFGITLLLITLISLYLYLKEIIRLFC